MNLRGGVGRLAHAGRDKPRAGMLDLVLLCKLEHAGGRPPGLYHDGPPGSMVGVFVYDPAAGEPVVPPDRVNPWALVLGGEVFPDDFVPPTLPTEEEDEHPTGES